MARPRVLQAVPVVHLETAIVLTVADPRAVIPNGLGSIRVMLLTDWLLSLVHHCHERRTT